MPQNIQLRSCRYARSRARSRRRRRRLAQAELNLAYTEILAPQDGWITSREVEQGDYVQVGQELMLIVTPDVWVTANFKEASSPRCARASR